MKKRILSLLTAFSMLLGLSACATEIRSRPGATPPTPLVDHSAPSDIQIYTDGCGRQVEIPTEIRRIVASGPLTQIILFAIAPEMLVGLNEKWSEGAKEYVADEYLSLPVFGQLYGSANLNVEELAAAAPDLIIDIGEGKPSVAEDMDKLQAQTQIPCIHIEATLATMPETICKLGIILGKQEIADELASFCEKVYQRTAYLMDRVGKNKVKALYILGSDGLNVLAKDSYHAELIDLLTDNLAVIDSPTARGTGNAVTMEQIALWNPDCILFAPGSIYATAAEREGWKELSAIQSGNYIEIPNDPYNWMGMPPAVQRYLGLIWLPSVLYPEYCDYDVKAEITEYYRLFYGCELTDEQYAALTANAFLRT